MFINEIPNNSRVVIRFESGNSHTELETLTKVAETMLRGKCYNATYIYKCEGKIVNPNSFKGTVIVSYMPPGASRPEIWNHVRIVYNKAKHEYIIETQANSRTIERRLHARVKIGVPAQVQLEDRSATYDCSVHDISATGIGITMPLTPTNMVGKRAYITFKDQKEFASFTLRATCVRTVQQSKNLYLYGFKFKNVTQELISYVATKRAKEKK